MAEFGALCRSEHRVGLIVAGEALSATREEAAREKGGKDEQKGETCRLRALEQPCHEFAFSGLQIPGP